ncbi:hypothetical protein NSQ61_19750 [Aeribacillus sp. FSL K6-1121]|uniref:DUF5415 family protein n=1 Tax=Aeribacillus sp. FSL K6-1121 TaxID=2954745 RepID=UPI0030FC4090
MAGRKKENPLQKAVEQILRKKNLDYNEWKKEVIYKRKLAVMADEDKEWIQNILKEESLQVIMNDFLEKDSQIS